MNFREAESLFMTARDKTAGKKIAGHTYIIKVGESYAIKFHYTNIVTFNPDGSVILFSGGYRTRTTKKRMNDALPNIHISQKNGLWYVNANGIQTLFEEHFIIPAGGVIPYNTSADTESAKKKIDKLVKTYINGFVQHLVENGIEQPSPGDCWHCLMKDANHPEKPDPMGIDHYLSHFEDKYYVPALFANAILERHYGSPTTVIRMMQRDPESLRSEGTQILRAFFQKRKISLVEALMRETI